MDNDLRVHRPQEEEEEAEAPDQTTLHQDGYRRVVLGQAADPLFPPPPAPAETSEDELEREALNDPDAGQRDASLPLPPFWRGLLLLAVVAVALSLIFWRWR